MIRLIFYSITITFICFCIISIIYQPVIIDEGLYLLPALRLMDGMTLYAEVFFNVGPPFAHIYGVGQKILGQGIIEGRLTSFFIVMITYSLICAISMKKAGKQGALIACAAYGLNLFTLRNHLWVKTYALTALLILVSVSLLHSERFGKKRILYAFIFAAMTALLRQTFFVVFAVMAVTVLISEKNRKQCFILMVAGSLTGYLAPLIPTLLHPYRSNIIYDLFTVVLTRGTDETYQGTFFHKLRIFDLLLSNYFLLLAFLVPAGIMALFQQKTSRLKEYFLSINGLMTSITIVIVLVYFLQPTIAWEGYFTEIMPFPCILLGCLYSSHLKPNQQNANLLTGVLITLFVITFLVQFKPFLYTPISEARINKYTSVGQIQNLQEFIVKHAGQNATLLTFETYLALDERIDVLPGLESSSYSYVPQWNTQKCIRYNLVNDTMIADYIINRVPDCIVFSLGAFKMLASHRSYGHGKPLSLNEIPPDMPTIDESFILKYYNRAGQIPAFGFWKYPVTIYFRKPILP